VARRSGTWGVQLGFEADPSAVNIPARCPRLARPGMLPVQRGIASQLGMVAQPAGQNPAAHDAHWRWHLEQADRGRPATRTSDLQAR
jgi:hypothetical protein